jgi:hypothetical protein
LTKEFNNLQAGAVAVGSIPTLQAINPSNNRRLCMMMVALVAFAPVVAVLAYAVNRVDL